MSWDDDVLVVVDVELSHWWGKNDICELDDDDVKVEDDLDEMSNASDSTDGQDDNAMTARAIMAQHDDVVIVLLFIFVGLILCLLLRRLLFYDVDV